MITEKKPKLSVVEHLREAGFRVTKRPATDAETLFRRLHKQVTNTDTTIPRDAVEECFREAGFRRFPTPKALDEAMRKLQILADHPNINRKSSSREDLIRATKPYLKALMAAREEWAYYLGRKPPSKSQAIDIAEIGDAIRLAKNICSRRVFEDLNADDWEQRVVRVAMIGRVAWKSVGKPPLDTTNPYTSPLIKFVVAAMALLGNPRRPKKDVKRAKATHSAEGEVTYVLKKHKRRLSF